MQSENSTPIITIAKNDAYCISRYIYFLFNYLFIHLFISGGEKTG